MIRMDFKIPPRVFQNESQGKNLTIRLPADMLAALEEAAKALQYKKTEIVAMLLDRFLQDLINEGIIKGPTKSKASVDDASESDNASKE